MTRSERYAAAAFLIGFAVCAVDAASKVVAVTDLSSDRSVTLLGGLITLRLYRNPGAAFGIGPSFTAVYALIAAGVLIAILRMSARLRSWQVSIAMGLLLGSAAGNLVDRIFRSPSPMRGFVIDWIRLPYFPPTFNIADSAITVGAALFFLAGLRGWRLDSDSSSSSADPRPAPPRAPERS